MRGFGRILVGVLWAAGCVDHTFDMLPDATPPSAGSAGKAPSAGAPGMAGRGMGGAGRPGTGTGGTFGSGGSGGTGAFGEGGIGDEPTCGPLGCTHCRSGIPGCIDCRVDADCAGVRGRPHCSENSGCVDCRPADSSECPTPGGCDDDCAAGERCDIYTYTCQADCRQHQVCPGNRSYCDHDHARDVCVECDPSPADVVACTDGLICSPFGDCGPCVRDADCNGSGTPSAFYRVCSQGRCVGPMPTPP